jgi:hypothetical protein
VPPHERLGPHNRQELAPFNELGEQDECDSGGIVGAARSDLAFDITGERFRDRFSAANCARHRNIRRNRRNRSATRTSEVRSTCGDDTV